jgi:predicted amidophosphoribosyltransferase
MAAFCTCCGAEITLKAEACPVCGTPRHGMLQSDRPLTLDVDTNLSQEDVGIGRESRRQPSRIS